jgi:hypothetical protein
MVIQRSRIIVLLAVLIVSGCHAGSPPTHYYAAGENWAIYLAWTEDTLNQFSLVVAALFSLRWGCKFRASPSATPMSAASPL